MFKRLVNEARIAFELETKGPLLIRQGDETALDPTIPDMQFVRSVDPATGIKSVYIPGSSQKGVFRSRSEQVLRGLLAGTGIQVCNLFSKETCGKREDMASRDGTERYQHHCPVCRLYGSFRLGSRVAFRDAFPVEGRPLVLGQRKNVAIDRISGAARGGALFTPEIVESGCFAGEITLTNFATWQLGLLLIVLEDLNLGFLGMGGGTSRGFGRVTIPSVSVRVRDYRKDAPDGECAGYRSGDRLAVPVAYTRGLTAHEATINGADLLNGMAQVDMARAIAADREEASARG